MRIFPAKQFRLALARLDYSMRERGGRKEMRFSFLIVAGEYVSYSRHETIKTEGKKLLRGNDDSQLVKDGFKSIPFL